MSSADVLLPALRASAREVSGGGGVALPRHGTSVGSDLRFRPPEGLVGPALGVADAQPGDAGAALRREAGSQRVGRRERLVVVPEDKMECVMGERSDLCWRRWADSLGVHAGEPVADRCRRGRGKESGGKQRGGPHCLPMSPVGEGVNKCGASSLILEDSGNAGARRRKQRRIATSSTATYLG